MAYSKNLNKDGARQRKAMDMPGLAASKFGNNNIISAPNIQFYELEAAEVLDVILDDSHPEFSDYRSIGSVKGRLVNSEKNAPLEQLSWFQPMSANIIDYPTIGEYVVTATYLSKKFYNGRINYLNDVNHNMFPGLSTSPIASTAKGIASDFNEAIAAGGTNTLDDNFLDSYSFAPNPNLKPIKLKPGEIVFNGRFGQSIKLGTAKEKTEAYSTPNIKIKVGQRLNADQTADISTTVANPIAEDINLDGSSFYMTTDEDIPLQEATFEAEQQYKSFENPPEKFDGKQIVLNSDRLIFNTRGKEFMCFSKLSQYFCTDDKFLVDSTSDIKFNTLTKTVVTSPEIFLGSEEATEPVVLGEVLKGLLEEIIDAITKSQFINGAGPASMNPGNVAGFGTIKGKLEKFLSPQNKTL